MKYEILVWVIIGILIIVGIVIFIEKENIDSKLIIDKNKGKESLNFIKLLVFILFITTQLPYSDKYNLYKDKEDFTKYNTPQVDSTMYLSSIDRNSKIYHTMIKDSVIHFIKKIDYDWHTIDKITDVFYNEKKELTLQLTFIKGSLFRKEKRINQLIIRKNCQDVVIDNLNESRKDSVLKAWGFDDKLYKQDSRY